MSRRLKQVVPVDPEVERVWEEYWRDDLTYHGEPNMDLIKRELFDYHVALQEVSKAYLEITNGRFSKLNTRAQVIIDCVNDLNVYDHDVPDRNIPNIACKYCGALYEQNNQV